MKNLPQRRSPRLQGYDYSRAGAYFVTICTHNRQHLFGTVADGAMALSPMGQIAHDQLASIPAYWERDVELDGFVVMPNHIHAIFVLVGTPFLASAVAPPEPSIPPRIPTLGTVISSYKSGVTRRIRAADAEAESPIWQERYHDHIIRDERDLYRIREYVAQNPARWSADAFFS